MFNGIIYYQGVVKKVIKRKKGINLFVYSKINVSKNNLGMSICCDGVCLTLINVNNKLMEFYLSKETINRSKFQKIDIGDLINIETPIKYGSKISGHITQGHVDCIGKINFIKKIDKSYLFDFIVKIDERKNLIEKASVSVNGISLTISKKTNQGFQSWIIPHTLKVTNLSKLRKSDLVNIEIDILSKYVRNYFNKK